MTRVTVTSVPSATAWANWHTGQVVAATLFFSAWFEDAQPQSSTDRIAAQANSFFSMASVPTNVTVGVRPMHITLTDKGIPATVDVSELMGSELHLHVNSNGLDVVIVVQTADIDLDAVHGGHKSIQYTFQPRLMHFFDKETEKNLF